MSRRAPGTCRRDGVGRLDDHGFERRPVDVHVVRRHGHDDRFALAVLPEEIDAELEMRALHLAIDGLADVVQERRAHGDVGVQPDFLRHDAREPRHLRRVREHVLAVARAELQASHQPENLGVEVVQAELERDRPALFAHLVVGFVLDLLDDLFDTGRMDPSVDDQPFDGFLRDLAPIGIETRQDDRARRIVDNEIDAGRQLEGADVAPLAADDAALEIVAREIDHRHRGLDGVLGGRALNRLGDVLFRAIGGHFARFGVEPLQEIGGIVPRFALDLLDEQLLRFVGRQAGDALELVLLLRDQAVVFLGRRVRELLAIGDRLLARLEVLVETLRGRLTLGQRRLEAMEGLLEGLGLVSIVARLLLGLGQDLVGLLFGLEQQSLCSGSRRRARRL